MCLCDRVSGSTLIKCGQTEQRLGQSERGFIQSTSNNFLQPLKGFLEMSLSRVIEPTSPPLSLAFVSLICRLQSLKQHNCRPRLPRCLLAASSLVLNNVRPTQPPAKPEAAAEPLESMNRCGAESACLASACGSIRRFDAYLIAGCSARSRLSRWPSMCQ